MQSATREVESPREPRSRWKLGTKSGPERHAGKRKRGACKRENAAIRRTRVTTALLGVPERGVD